MRLFFPRANALRLACMLMLAWSGSGEVVAQAPETASSAPAIGTVRHGDWYFRCAGSRDSGARQCEVAQIAQVASDGRNVNVLTLAIAPVKPDGNGAPPLLLTALAPLNVLLPEQLELSVDGRSLVTIVWRNCNEAGCWAQQRLTPAMLERLKRGRAGGATMVLMNGETVTIGFPLHGLTAALADLGQALRR